MAYELFRLRAMISAALVSTALFGTALTLPSVRVVVTAENTLRGWEAALFTGIFGATILFLFAPLLLMPNVGLGVALVLAFRGHVRASCVISGLSGSLAVASSLVFIDPDNGEAFLIGHWFWMASFFSLFVASSAIWLLDTKKRHSIAANTN